MLVAVTAMLQKPNAAMIVTTKIWLPTEAFLFPPPHYSDLLLLQPFHQPLKRKHRRNWVCAVASNLVVGTRTFLYVFYARLQASIHQPPVVPSLARQRMRYPVSGE